MDFKNLPKSLIATATKLLDESIDQREYRDTMNALMEAVSFSRPQMTVLAQAISGAAGLEMTDGESPEYAIKRAVQTFITKSHSAESWKTFGKMITVMLSAGISFSGVLANQKMQTLKAIGVLKVFETDNQAIIDRFTVIIGDDVFTMSENASAPNGINQYAGKLDDQDEDPGKEVQVFGSLPQGVISAIRDRLSQY